MENVRTLYQDSLTFDHIYLTDPAYSRCLTVADNVQHLLARWYYGYTSRQNRSDEEIIAIVTTACIESTKISQSTASRNILTITSLDKDISIRNRVSNPTWITASPYMTEQDVYCCFLHYANWTDVFLVLPQPGARQWLHLISRTLLASLKLCGIRVTGSQIVGTPSLLRNFVRESRVILFLAETYSFRNLLLEASAMNIMEGEHVLIVAEDFRDTNITRNTSTYSPFWFHCVNNSRLQGVSCRDTSGHERSWRT